MDALIKLADRLICIAACMFLGAFLSENDSISHILFAVSLIILIPCLVFLVIESLFFQKLPLIMQQVKESHFFWAGYFLLVCTVLWDSNFVWAVVFGMLSLFHIAATIYTFFLRPKAL